MHISSRILQGEREVARAVREEELDVQGKNNACRRHA